MKFCSRNTITTSSLLIVWTLVLLQEVSASDGDIPTATTASTIDHAKLMIGWVRSEGGLVNEKLEVRRRDLSDENSPLGVFALAALTTKEPILQVPRHLYISLAPDEIVDAELYGQADSSMDDIMVAYYANTCRLAHKVIDEVTAWRAADPTTKSSSKYGPFLAYLETVPMGQLPATYSPQGKAKLRDIMGKKPTKNMGNNKMTNTQEVMTLANYGNYTLPPWQLADWIDIQFKETGCIAPDDPEAEHAVAVAIQRGFDSELIPIWDMFNHDNGKLNVDTNSIRAEEGVQVWAAKDIAAGEEIFATYNFCHDCFDVGDDWGTPGIFRDFGFVEDYPQVWPFLEHGIYFEVDWDKNNTDQLIAIFDVNEETGKLHYVPDAKGLKFMRTELKRLKQLDLWAEEEDNSDKNNMPEHEQFMIQKYHETLISALTSGIAATLKVMYPPFQGEGDEL